MSILIKGMKMLKECRDCPFIGYYWKSGETLCSVNSKIMACNFKPIAFDGRHTDCPLVEIPPHGRLIDVDALKLEYGMKDDCNDCEREMRGSVKACEYDTVYTKMNFCEWLDYAPVVIEAEEDQEE